MNYLKYKGSKDFTNKDPVLSLPNNFVFEFSSVSNYYQYIIIEASVPNTEVVYTFILIHPIMPLKELILKNRKEFIRGEWAIKMINNTQRFRENGNGKWDPLDQDAIGRSKKWILRPEIRFERRLLYGVSGK